MQGALGCLVIRSPYNNHTRWVITSKDERYPLVCRCRHGAEKSGHGLSLINFMKQYLCCSQTCAVSSFCWLGKECLGIHLTSLTQIVFILTADTEQRLQGQHVMAMQHNSVQIHMKKIKECNPYLGFWITREGEVYCLFERPAHFS